MTAERLLINADIRTMDPGLPRTDAILLRGGKVVALGRSAKTASAPPEDMQGRAAAKTRRVRAFWLGKRGPTGMASPA